MAGTGFDSIVDKILDFGGDSAASLDRFRMSVFVDEGVSAELLQSTRAALSPRSHCVRMDIRSFHDDMPQVDDDADLLVVLAADSLWVGAAVEVARVKGVPAVVLADRLNTVVRNAERTGFPIDYDCVISRESVKAVPFVGASKLLSGAARSMGFAKSIASYDDMLAALARWVMRECPQLADAFAEAFEFARGAKLDKIVRNTSYQNAVTGARFVSKGADFPVMTLNQIKMLLQLERAHGYSIDKQTLFEAALVCVMALASRSIVRRLVHAQPMLSWVIKTLAGYLVTLGMGEMLKSYFEGGREMPLYDRVAGLLGDRKRQAGAGATNASGAGAGSPATSGAGAD